jgi:hypothetical protein
MLMTLGGERHGWRMSPSRSELSVHGALDARRRAPGPPLTTHRTAGTFSIDEPFAPSFRVTCLCWRPESEADLVLLIVRRGDEAPAPPYTQVPPVRYILAVAGTATLIVGGIAAIPFASHRVAQNSQVMVHCPNGNQAAFVTPVNDTIAVGDSVVWRTTGQATSDSLVISLKDSDQAWPFAGTAPSGTTSAQTGKSQTTGTYGYNVHLVCRVRGGGTQSVTIDPDIIIE